MEEFRLAAILPPGNMERVIADLKRSIARVCAAISPFALPPLVPFAYVDAALDLQGFARRLQRSMPRLHCSIGEFDVTPEGLYLSIVDRCFEAAEAIARHALGGAHSAQEGPIALRSAIYLGAMDVVEYADDILRLVELPGENRFGGYRVSVLLVRSRGGERWWEQVWWKEMVSVPIK